MAGAVFVDRGILEGPWPEAWKLVNDSKQLTAARRDEIFGAVEEACRGGRLVAASGTASVREIATENILGATRLAMQRALEAACPEERALPHASVGELFGPRRSTSTGGCILIDGKRMHRFPYTHVGVVKGDGCSFAIALASIIAKVVRDRLMEDLDVKFPQYGFRDHKGYGTPAHRSAILAYGATPVHRPLFLRNLLGVDGNAGGAACGQEETGNPIDPMHRSSGNGGPPLATDNRP